MAGDPPKNLYNCPFSTPYIGYVTSFENGDKKIIELLEKILEKLEEIRMELP